MGSPDVKKSKAANTLRTIINRLFNSFLLTTFLILLSTIRAEDIAPSRTLFATPDSLEIDENQYSIKDEFELGENEPRIYILPISEFDGSFELTQLKLRDERTNKTRTLDANNPEDRDIIRKFERAFTLEEFGTLRRIKVAKLSANNRSYLREEETSWNIHSFGISFRHGGFSSSTDIASKDTALSAGPYRDVIDHTLLTPPEITNRFISRLPVISEGETPPAPSSPVSVENLALLEFSIENDDFYSIDRRWFEGSDLSIEETLSPEHISIYTNGKSVPLFYVSEKNRPFNSGGRVIFYGKGNPSTETREQTYYLELSQTPKDGPSWEVSKESSHTSEVDNFLRKIRFEEDNDRKLDLGAFLSISDMNWIWDQVSEAESLQVKFDLPGLIAQTEDDETSDTVEIRTQLYIPSGTSIRRDQWVLEARVNSAQSEELPLIRKKTEYLFKFSKADFGYKNNQVHFRLKPLDEETGKKDTGTPELYLDYIDITYPSLFLPIDSRLEFTSQRDWQYPVELQIAGFPRSEPLVVDLSNNDQPEIIPVRSVRPRQFFTLNRPGAHVVLLDERRISSPPPCTPAAKWTAEEVTQGGDVLIIYEQSFVEPAENLAQLIHSYEGYKVQTISTDLIYAAFSHGNKSISGIKDYLTCLVNAEDTRNPHTVILMGDATSDGWNESRENLPNHVPMPSDNDVSGKEVNAISSDVFYARLSKEDTLSDLIIARIPSATIQDAKAYISNLSQYREMSMSTKPWPKNMMLVIDTGKFTETIDEMLDTSYDPEQQITYIYADEMAWEDNYYLPPHLISRKEDSKVSPIMTSHIEEGFNDGHALVVYAGHGAPNLWSNQRFWFGGGTPNSDILRLNNAPYLPFVVSFTCNNAVIDYPLKPWNICIAEDYLRHEGKGAIACFMPSGPGYMHSHKYLASGLLKAWTEFGIQNIGQLCELSRIYYMAHANNDDQSRMFMILGDPTVDVMDPKMGKQKKPRWLDERGKKEQLKISSIDRILDNENKEQGLHLVIDNDHPTELSSNLTIRYESYDGEELKDTSVSVTAPPLGKKYYELLYTQLGEPVEPGLITIELDYSTSKGFSETLPSTRTTILYFGTESNPSPVFVAPSFELSSQPARHAHPSSRIILLNPGDSNTSFTLSVNVEYANKSVYTETKPIELLEARNRFTIDSRLTEVPLTITAPLRFIYELREPGEEGRVLAKHEQTIPPTSLPDISILQDSFEITPSSPSDGLTIFVEGELKNSGNSTSEQFEVALYRASDVELKSPLRNHIARPELIVAPLSPGETRKVRLRWDPVENAGNQHIVVVADPKENTIDTNRENNRTSLKFKVKTKSRLVPGDLLVGQVPGTSKLRLVAKVKNTGETDSSSVAVNFYRTQEQKSEDLLGEIVVDEVPAGKTVDISYDWDVKDEMDNLKEAKPSFTVSLKGSLMRTSSVSD